jgi:hypothetical protein
VDGELRLEGTKMGGPGDTTGVGRKPYEDSVVNLVGPLGHPWGMKMGGPRDTTGVAGRVAILIKFSNNRGPTLRTPCGEERSARTSKERRLESRL